MHRPFALFAFHCQIPSGSNHSRYRFLDKGWIEGVSNQNMNITTYSAVTSTQSLS